MRIWVAGCDPAEGVGWDFVGEGGYLRPGTGVEGRWESRAKLLANAPSDIEISVTSP